VTGSSNYAAYKMLLQLSADFRAYDGKLAGKTITECRILLQTSNKTFNNDECVCRSGLLHVGDRILAVDGVQTSGKSADEVSSLLASNRTSHIRIRLLSASAARLLGERRAAAISGQ